MYLLIVSFYFQEGFSATTFGIIVIFSVGGFIALCLITTVLFADPEKAAYTGSGTLNKVVSIVR